MIFDILLALAATTKRNEKIAILEKHKNNQDLKQFFKLALDPMIQFYIRKIPAYDPYVDGKLSLEKVMTQMVAVLSTRLLTGNAAIDWMANQLSQMSLRDAAVIELILKKDPSCGVADSTVNKVWPKLVSEWPCMLCSAYDEKLVNKIKYPAIVQKKMDGMRFNVIVNDGKIEFRSRSGKLIEFLDHLEQDFQALMPYGNFVYDGELTVVGDDGKEIDRATGNGLIRRATFGNVTKEQAETIHGTLWDKIPYKDFLAEKCTVPYLDRLTDLKLILSENSDAVKKLHLVESRVINSSDEADAIFDEWYNQGFEGSILKDKNGIWENKRVKTQIKFKGELDCDLVITGFEEGDGKRKGKIGAILGESSDGLVKSKVGSGLTDEFLEQYTPANFNEKLLGKIMSVEYNALSQDKHGNKRLSHSRLLSVRTDKTKADSSKGIK